MLTIWAGRALACARYTQDPNEERCRGLLDASGSAGVLSRGVGLRGFESHPPHQWKPSGLHKQGALLHVFNSSSDGFFSRFEILHCR